MSDEKLNCVDKILKEKRELVSYLQERGSLLSNVLTL